MNAKNLFGKITCDFVLSVLAVLAWNVPPANAQTPVVWLQAEGNLLDSSGMSNNAVAVDPVIYTAGHSGQAFYTEGGSIRVANAPGLQPATNLTVQAWVKSVTTLTGGGFRYIVSKSNAGSSSYAFYTASGGGLAFFVVKAGTAIVTTAATPAAIWDNNWHQITGVYDGTNVQLYIDGALVGASAKTGAGAITYTTTVNNGDLLIGNYTPPIGGAGAYIGAIDDVKIFNTAMSAANVLDTFQNASSPAGTNGLVAWWQGEGNALDSWGNNNGILSSPATVTYFPGKSGQGLLSPNGVVQVPDSNGVLDSSSLTVQAWVQSVAPGTFQYVLFKPKEGQPSYGLYTASGGGAAFFVNLNSGDANLVLSPQAAPGAVWDGAWHQLTGVYDGSAVSLYLDGLEVTGTNTPGSGPVAYTTNLLGGNLLIGNNNNFSFPFSGVVDEVKIWNQALTPSEILAAYSGSNLVSWWPAEGNPNDAFGLNNGSLSGAVSYVAGRATGKAFHTTAGAVVIPDSPSLQLPAVTVAALVSASAPGPNRYVISKSFTPSSASYALYSGTGGGLAFYVTLASGVVSSAEVAAATIWDGNFHAIAGTYDGSAARLYVDGAQVGSDVSGTGPIQYGASQSSGELLFGDFADTLTTSNFNGIIDEVKVYNSSLSAAAVKADAFMPLIITTQPANTTAVQGSQAAFTVTQFGQTPLSFQWRFNGTNIPGATNSTLTLPNVQLGNAGQYSVSITAKSLGYTNSALGTGQAFKMSGGAVDVPNDPTLDPASLSVQTWVRSATLPGTFRYIVSKSKGTGTSSYALYTGSAGGLEFYIGVPGGIVSPNITSNTVWNGAWHQVTGTFTDLGIVHIYLDGVEVGTGTDSFLGSINYAPGAFSGDLWLGDFSALSTASHFSGDMDEVKIFNHELSAGDVLDTYNNPSGAAATNGLISWWGGDGNALDEWGFNNGRPLPLPGSIVSGNATLIVVAPAVLSNSQVSGGHFHATVTGTPGLGYTVMSSPDLFNWTPVVTNTSPFLFTDPSSASLTEFYRAVYP